ncbi:hypothetical protein TSH100_09200 [Azospirillum sp. TSH100]|nr:hypothetical protein TSH100_09200 [Azospirillum sp. TSH100]
MVFFLRVIRSPSVASLHQVPSPDGISFGITAVFQGFGIPVALLHLRLAKASDRGKPTFLLPQKHALFVPILTPAWATPSGRKFGSGPL